MMASSSSSSLTINTSAFNNQQNFELDQLNTNINNNNNKNLLISPYKFGTLTSNLNDMIDGKASTSSFSSSSKSSTSSLTSSSKKTSPSSPTFNCNSPQVHAKNDLDSSMIQCWLCNKKLSEPKLLNCLHVFCKSCILTHLISNQSSLSEDSTLLRCPKCKQETPLPPNGNIDMLQDDHVMQNLLDMKSIEDMELSCTSCKTEEKAVARCRDCANFLCNNCVSAHRFMRCFENHMVVTFEDIKATYNNNISHGVPIHKPILCKFHLKEELKYFCFTCQTTTCNDCILSLHSPPDHVCERISEMSTKQKEELSFLIQTTKESINITQNEYKAFDQCLVELNEQVDVGRQDVNETHEALKLILDKKKDLLLKELEEKHRNKESSVKETASSLDDWVEKLNYLINFCERTIKNANAQEILLIKPLIRQQLKYLISHQPRSSNIDVSLKFVNSEKKFEEALMEGDLFGRFYSNKEYKQLYLNKLTHNTNEQNDRQQLQMQQLQQFIQQKQMQFENQFDDTEAIKFNSQNQSWLVPNILNIANKPFNNAMKQISPPLIQSKLQNNWSATSQLPPHAAGPSSAMKKQLEELQNFRLLQQQKQLLLQQQQQYSNYSRSQQSPSISRSQTPPPLTSANINMNVLQQHLASIQIGTTNLNSIGSACSSSGGSNASNPGNNAATQLNPTDQQLLNGFEDLLYVSSKLPTNDLIPLNNLNQLVMTAAAAVANGHQNPISPPLSVGTIGSGLGNGVQQSSFAGNGNLNPPVRQNGKMDNMSIKAKFGTLGSGKSQFNSPHGFCLGVDEEIIVADTNNHRIQIFDKHGELKSCFGSSGREEGQLWYPRKVTVMRDSGKFVVCDRGNERSRMQIFSRNGTFIKKIAIRYIDIVAGLAITQQGDIVAVDSVSPTVFRLSENGDLIKWFDCSDYMREPSDIAISGNEYFVCDFKGHCVAVFSDDGVFLRRIGGENITNFPNGIDVSDAGDVLVGDSHGNRFHVAVFSRDGIMEKEFECPYVKVSRCCGLKITTEGNVVTLAKNNHHVLVLDTLHI